MNFEYIPFFGYLTNLDSVKAGFLVIPLCFVRKWVIIPLCFIGNGVSVGRDRHRRVVGGVWVYGFQQQVLGTGDLVILCWGGSSCAGGLGGLPSGGDR